MEMRADRRFSGWPVELPATAAIASRWRPGTIVVSMVRPSVLSWSSVMS
jgi:hypothetical protein